MIFAGRGSSNVPASADANRRAVDRMHHQLFREESLAYALVSRVSAWLDFMELAGFEAVVVSRRSRSKLSAKGDRALPVNVPGTGGGTMRAVSASIGGSQSDTSAKPARMARM